MKVVSVRMEDDEFDFLGFIRNQVLLETGINLRTTSDVVRFCVRSSAKKYLEVRNHDESE